MMLPLRYIALLFFNLLPLVFVIDGMWRPFDVLAFYWLELVAVGFFALLKSAMSAVYHLSQKKIGVAAGEFFSLAFFPLHFGFFLILLCFPVGSFLPPDAPTRPLTDPLIPLIVVIENMDFFFLLPLAMMWQSVFFLIDFIVPRAYRKGTAGIYAQAYGSVAILFVSGFFGILIGMATDERIWGAVILVLLKTLVTLVAAHIAARQSAPAGTSAAI